MNKYKDEYKVTMDRYWWIMNECKSRWMINECKVSKSGRIWMNDEWINAWMYGNQERMYLDER